MRSHTFKALAAAAVLPSAALAHYNFESLIVNGQGTEPYQYVRQTTNSNSPVEDVTSPAMVCNQGGNDADIRAKTQTHDVLPGDEVGFDINSELGHPGPLAVYMSRAPDGTAASDYTGDGDWFKILNVTGRTEQSLDYSLPENEGFYDQLKSRWGTFRLDSVRNATLTPTLPM